MDRRRIDYRAWFLKVLAWDGGLPTLVAFAPFGVELLFPGRRGFIEITSIAVPIVACLIRGVHGKRQIEANHCGPILKEIQLVVFYIAIVPLVLIDCFLVLIHLMPMPPRQAQPVTDNSGVYLVFGIVLGYLALMTFAMYPGRTLPPRAERDDPWRDSAFPD